eukprot:scaffold1259_cov239-Pinguiococcus_pyrenoidosus.AAC.1
MESGSVISSRFSGTGVCNAGCAGITFPAEMLLVLPELVWRNRFPVDHTSGVASFASFQKDPNDLPERSKKIHLKPHRSLHSPPPLPDDGVQQHSGALCTNGSYAGVQDSVSLHGVAEREDPGAIFLEYWMVRDAMQVLQRGLDVGLISNLFCQSAFREKDSQ